MEELRQLETENGTDAVSLAPVESLLGFRRFLSPSRDLVTCLLEDIRYVRQVLARQTSPANGAIFDLPGLLFLRSDTWNEIGTTRATA